VLVAVSTATLLLAGVPVARAMQRAFVTSSGAVVTPVTTGTVTVEVDGLASLVAPVDGLRPDDLDPGDDVPADAFVDRTVVVRNASTGTGDLWIGAVADPPLAGLRFGVRDVGGAVVVADGALPRARAELAARVPSGAEVAVVLRVRLAHDAPADVQGARTVLRVTIGVDTAGGAAR
jgi:hypothetical protein